MGIRERLKLKKQPPLRRRPPKGHPGWWNDKRQCVGVKILARLFRLDRAELFSLTSQYLNRNSKATKKGHIHQTRPAGSKLMKKYYRQHWLLWTGMGE